ncbi:MAG: hypothetical protein ACI4EA_10955 [Candidatus Ornithomonoglobus sp.]
MYIKRRLIETLIISLISTVPIYLLIKSGFVAKTNSAMGMVFAISAFIFYFLHLFAFKRHLIAVEKTSSYLIVNFGILAIHAALCVIFKKFIGISAYETFFGFTSMFCYLYLPRKLSVTLIYLAYAAEIFFFPIDRWVQYKYYLTDKEKKKLEEKRKQQELQ